MKRCVKTHKHKRFGEIPEGSLWDEDSPYLDDKNFEDVPVKKRANHPTARVVDPEQTIAAEPAEET